jgi:hypothetical protein
MKSIIVKTAIVLALAVVGTAVVVVTTTRNHSATSPPAGDMNAAASNYSAKFKLVTEPARFPSRNARTNVPMQTSNQSR